MRYVSTRGGMPPLSFSDILIAGLAPDGGLVVPEHYPPITDDELNTWRSYDYRQLAFALISRFISDVPAADLKTIIDNSYTTAIFGHADITPIKPLTDGIYVLGLSNGPTLAFKDLAMQFLGNIFDYVLAQRGEHINILGATSGDTGSAAEYAMLGKHNVNVFMLSPDQKVSPFQAAQMFSLDEPNIFNIAIKGVFDDCQDIVKAVNQDAAFKARYQIGAVNSINWGRIVAQIVYYFKAYLAITTDNQQQIDMAVPSGNFGNIYAGHIAKQMGLPIRKLILATNENNVLDEFFRSGLYRVRPADEVHKTSSPSMDISKASNFERFIYDAVGRDADVVNSLWQQLRENGAFDFTQTPYWQDIKQFGFVSGSSSHTDRMHTIKSVHEQYGVIIDTHTADGLKVGLEYKEKGIPLICQETALPCKFEDAVFEALKRKPERPPGYENIEDKPQQYDVMDADAEAIKAYIMRRAQ